MTLVRPRASAAADADGAYPSSAAAACTRARVGADTPGLPRSARDTVAGDTWARAATSTMPTGPVGTSSLDRTGGTRDCAGPADGEAVR